MGHCIFPNNIGTDGLVPVGNSSGWCAAVAAFGLVLSCAAWSRGGDAGRVVADAVTEATGVPREPGCARLLREYAVDAMRAEGAGMIPTGGLFRAWRDRDAAAYMDSPCPAGPFLATSFAVRAAGRRPG